MIPLELLRELYLHMEWADARVWRAALVCPAAVRDTRLRDLLLHLHAVQRGFLSVWTQQPVQFPKPEDMPDLTFVERWSRSVYAEGHRFLGTLDTAALAQPVVMPWAAQIAARIGCEPRKPTLAETVLQVASHSTYHRGQVNARLREVGGEPPLVDFIAWIWFDRPAPEWQEIA